MYSVLSHPKKMYQLRLTRYAYGEKHYSYIQLSHKTGRPIIHTDIGYKIYSVLLFSSEMQAYEFLYNLCRINDNVRCQKFEVVEYKGRTKKLYEFKTNCGICYTYRDFMYKYDIMGHR